MAAVEAIERRYSANAWARVALSGNLLHAMPWRTLRSVVCLAAIAMSPATVGRPSAPIEAEERIA
ncbi:MAG: hypothetical protein ACREFQ_01620 [Stellaceae bacterium]